MKKKAYICFDYDNDFELKECLVGQAKNPDSPFSISDVSIKQEIQTNWKFMLDRKYEMLILLSYYAVNILIRLRELPQNLV